MMKRILSMVLSAAMTVSLLTVSPVMVSATGNWGKDASTGMHGWNKLAANDEIWEKLDVSAVGADKVAPHSGSRSMRLEYNSESAEWIVVRNMDLNLSQPGKYRLSFSLHPSVASDKNGETDLATAEKSINIGFGAKNWNISQIIDTQDEFSLTRTVDETTGWATYTSTPFEYDGQAGDTWMGPEVSSFWFWFYNNWTLGNPASGTTVYMDDIEVVRVDEFGNTVGENLIVNPGFEEYEEAGRPEQMYEPINPMMGLSTNTDLTLAWKNPKVDDGDSITSIKIYDVNGNEDVEIVPETPLDLTPGNVVKYPISGREYGVNYYYKIVFEFAEHDAAEVTISGTPKENIWTGEYFTKGWVLDGGHRRGDTEGKLPIGEFAIDTEVKHSGKASLRVNPLAVREGNDVDMALLAGDLGILPLSQQAYKISFWMKADDLSGVITPDFNWARPTSSMFSGTSEWQYHEMIMDYPYETGFFNDLAIYINGTARNVWLDDIEIYPVKLSRDENENIISAVISGENLMKDYNGGFEADADDIPANVTNVQAVAGEESVMLNWTKANSTEKTNIYLKNSDGSLSLRASLVGDKQYMNITNLKGGVENTFVIKSVNKRGQESTGVEVTATPTIIPVKLGEFNLYKDGGKVTNITTGEHSVSISVNNQAEQEYSVQLIVAAYDENDVLLDVEIPSSAAVTLGMNDKKTLSVMMNIPENAAKIKAFLWKDIDSMVVRKRAKTFTK